VGQVSANPCLTWLDPCSTPAASTSRSFPLRGKLRLASRASIKNALPISVYGLPVVAKLTNPTPRGEVYLLYVWIDFIAASCGELNPLRLKIMLP
jgi:hypothetical protein